MRRRSRHRFRILNPDLRCTARQLGVGHRVCIQTAMLAQRVQERQPPIGRREIDLLALERKCAPAPGHGRYDARDHRLDAIEIATNR